MLTPSGLSSLHTRSGVVVRDRNRIEASMQCGLHKRSRLPSGVVRRRNGMNLEIDRHTRIPFTTTKLALSGYDMAGNRLPNMIPFEQIMVSCP